MEEVDRPERGGPIGGIVSGVTDWRNWWMVEVSKSFGPE